MHEDTNINPVWDGLMGGNTNIAVIRVVLGLLVFAVIGGIVSWLIG